MRVIFESNAPRKGSAVLVTNQGEEVARLECWAHVHQARAMALEHFEHYLHRTGKPLKEGERLAFTIMELAR